MWRRAVIQSKAFQSWQLISTRGAASGSGKHGSAPPSAAAAVDSLLLRSLKEHYLDVSKMNPPPKVNPPSPFTIIKGALDSNGPVLKRTYGKEEISIFVMRLANIVRGEGDDPEEDGINQLFLHVDVSKPEQEDSLQFLCGLYPDALGIHSVSMRPKVDFSADVVAPSKYNGPVFEDLDEKMRDAFHSFIEERGVNESLFPFLQAWLYVKDHRNLLSWFKSVDPKHAPRVNKILSSIEKFEQRHRHRGIDGIESESSIGRGYEYGDKDPVAMHKEARRRRSRRRHWIQSRKRGRHCLSNEDVARLSWGECHDLHVNRLSQPSTELIKILPSVDHVAQGRVDTSSGVDEGPLGSTQTIRGAVSLNEGVFGKMGLKIFWSGANVYVLEGQGSLLDHVVVKRGFPLLFSIIEQRELSLHI